MHGLRSYLDELESRGHIIRITKPVDVGHELAAIQWQVEREMYKGVIFENVRGYDAKVVGNLYLLPLRMGITPTIPMMEEFLEVYASLKKPGIVYPVWAANDMWMQMYHEVEEVVINGLRNPVEPVLVDNANLTNSVTSNIDILAQLPIPKYFNQDAGHYITTGVTIARDPETKYLNAGIYRIQVIDKDRLAVMVNVKRDMLSLLNSAQRSNSKLDVAIAIGVCPQLMIAATMSAPYGQSELQVAGGLAGRPLELIPGQTVDLCVPAHAEIVIEGSIDPNERTKEGPFTEYDLLASQPSNGFVIRVSSIRSRENPLYHSLVCTSLEMISVILPLGITETMNTRAFLKHVSRNVRDVWMLPGVAGTGLVVSIDKEHDAEPQEIIQSLFAFSARYKRIVVVDGDIDIYDPFDVQWAIDTRVCYRRDIIVVEARGEVTDAARLGDFSVKMGIDATQKSGHPSKFQRSDTNQFMDVDLSAILASQDKSDRTDHAATASEHPKWSESSAPGHQETKVGHDERKPGPVGDEIDVGVTLESIVGTANTTPKIQAMLRGWNKTIILKVEDIDYAVKCEAQNVSLKSEPVENADVSFEMNRRTFALIVSRQVTPLAAKMRGMISSKGRLLDILKFVSILKAALIIRPFGRKDP